VIVAFEKQEDRSAVQVRRLQESIEAIGGTVDGGPARMLVFTVPVCAGFQAVEGLLTAFTQELPGTRWWYSNVYETGDPSQSLNWWKENK
jgi:hypothetical protein